MATEDDVDRIADRLSRYITELLPHLQDKNHAAILDQYYKMTKEFERLGDQAVNIATSAADLEKKGTRFSAAAMEELTVLETLVQQVLRKAELAFARRDVDEAFQIEPLVRVADDLMDHLKGSHLKRLSDGQCNIFADASYTNLLAEMKRVADLCSNIGTATVIRVRPELADHKHDYYAHLHSGGDAEFRAAYEQARKNYFDLLPAGE
jgi:phosphate:Na+ symporter